MSIRRRNLRKGSILKVATERFWLRFPPSNTAGYVGAIAANNATWQTVGGALPLNGPFVVDNTVNSPVAGSNASPIPGGWPVAPSNIAFTPAATGLGLFTVKITGLSHLGDPVTEFLTGDLDGPTVIWSTQVLRFIERIEVVEPPTSAATTISVGVNRAGVSPAITNPGLRLGFPGRLVSEDHVLFVTDENSNIIPVTPDVHNNTLLVAAQPTEKTDPTNCWIAMSKNAERYY